MSAILSFFRKNLNVWSATLSTSTVCGFEYHDPLYFSKSIGEHESREQGDEVFRRARRPLSLQAQWLGAWSTFTRGATQVAKKPVKVVAVQVAQKLGVVATEGSREKNPTTIAETSLPENTFASI